MRESKPTPQLEPRFSRPPTHEREHLLAALRESARAPSEERIEGTAHGTVMALDADARVNEMRPRRLDSGARWRTRSTDALRVRVDPLLPAPTVHGAGGSSCRSRRRCRPRNRSQLQAGHNWLAARPPGTPEASLFYSLEARQQKFAPLQRPHSRVGIRDCRAHKHLSPRCKEGVA